MDQDPLVTEQIDAGSKFVGELEKRFPLLAAFWLKANEEGSWHLYVTSDQFNDENFRAVHGEVGRVLTEMRDPELDLFRVNLIQPSDPLAKDAIHYLQLYPGRKGFRLRNRNFGGISRDEVYLYGTPIAGVHTRSLSNGNTNITAFEGFVENGQIKLPEAVHLAEQTRVYVIVPATETAPPVRIGSPRLARPEDAADFVKEVSEEPEDSRV